MRELDFINIIENKLTKKSYIGDDCAYLKDLGIVVTHDSLVEDVHFLTKFSSPSDIAYKSIAVNLSDIYAAGAIPKYLTIALSLPKSIDKTFIEDFYEKVNEMSLRYNFEVIGGDITGSEKIMISVCAMGITEGRNISSRNKAQVGDVIVTTGFHGSSAAGLFALGDGLQEKFPNLVEKHLHPLPQENFSREIALNVKRYSMMDSSDGLADAIFKISSASRVSAVVDFQKIPYDNEIVSLANLNGKNYKDWILFGGEDFELVATLPENNLQKIDADYKVIGKIESAADGCATVTVIDGNQEYKIDDLEKCFNHFEEK
jgi:thiamine-monophosphate kinase